LRTCWRRLASIAARAYVTGPELGDALRACRHVSARGFASTVGFWNEGGEPLRQVAGEYLAALDAVSTERLDCYLSLKAPALGFSRQLLAEVLERGRAVRVPIHFDSLGPETVDPTLAAIDAMAGNHPGLGCTLPGRWRRSVADAERMVELGMRVRLVKGQFEDRQAAEIDPGIGVLALADRLAGRARHVAVATHDAALARPALERLRAAGTPCEMELLFGLPLAEPLRVAAELGVSARLYVPYGAAWLPYALSQARRNPGMVWWIVRDLATGSSFRLPRKRASGSPAAAVRDRVA
jgi:proline dehydrogenase